MVNNNETIIELSHLAKSFGKNVVLKDINLSVKKAGRVARLYFIPLECFAVRQIPLRKQYSLLHFGGIFVARDRF